MSLLRNLANSMVDDPVAGCARPTPSPPPRPGEADVSIGRPDRPSSIVTPEPKSLKRIGDVVSSRRAAQTPSAIDRPKSANNNSLKRNCRSAAQALNQIERVSLRASRAREGSECR